MSNDLGTQADRDVNAGTLSNQSGDTFLLTDEEDINTYADILRRQNSATRPTGPNISDFLGRGRAVTDFERTHFGLKNITPGRPCTAYFSADYFVDSKAVFDKLDELAIPRESVVCLQRRPSREVLITFTDEATKNKFVSAVVLRFRDSSCVIDDEDMPLTYLTVYDAPHELPDEALNLRLGQYCTVFSARRGKYSNRNSHVYNGLRHYRVRINEPLPSYLRFGKFLVRLSHDGQQHTCRRCNRAGHFANECRNVICFNCEELGHQSRECESDRRCCICKSIHHLANRCQYSWFQPPSTSQAAGPVAAGARSDENEVVCTNPPGSSVDPPVDVSCDSDLPLDSVADSDLLLAAAGTSSQASGRLSGEGPGEPSGELPTDPPSVRAVLSDESPTVSPGVSAVPSGGPSSQVSGVLSGVSAVPSGEPSSESAEQCLDSGGFIWEQVADRLRKQGLVPNSPEPPSTPSQDVDDMSPELFSSPSPVPPAVTVPSDEPPGDDPPNEQPLVPPVEKPITLRSSVASSRRKPAPLPAALEALARRPTRPSRPVSGKSAPAGSAPPSDDDDAEDMETQSSLKRKQEQIRKKGGPKKGKH